MKRSLASEKILLEEASLAAKQAKIATRGMSIGALIKLIRIQLGMSQKNLAKRARVPQPTISHVEREREANLSTLEKILDALCSDLVIVPILREPIETLRRKQARKVAEKQMRYLRGTMNLEKQKPDPRLMEELLKQEEEHLLHSKKTNLWEE